MFKDAATTLKLPLSETQIDRYARHILLPEVGGVGQQKLLQSKVLIVGVGGLGVPAALYLAAAGIGVLGVVDFDQIDLSNLQRQVLYNTDEVGQSKVGVAVNKLARLNPDTTLIPYEERLGPDNVNTIFSDYDLIIDGSDNFDTRYLVNDACVRLGKPNAFGSVLGFEGQATLFGPEGPCYRCIFPAPPPPGAVPSCAQAGVMGAVAGLVGTIQATEAIKWLLGIGHTLVGRLLLIDLLNMQFDEVQISQSPDCPACSARPT